LTGQVIGWSRGGVRRDRAGTGTIPVEVYDQLYTQFNPTLFNAEETVELFYAAGARYLVFVTKHHDGFNMYDTALSDYKITAPESPFGRDIAGELAEACARRGLKVIWYFSLGDWYDPNFYTANHDRFMDYMFGQIAELSDKYGPAAGFWFDLKFDKIGKEESQRILDTILRRSPLAIVNNRFGQLGDYDTPEQYVGMFQNRRPWESCITLGDAWSWKPNDCVKTSSECIRTLIRCAGGDGNLLLNVGPMPDGRIEPRQAERLQDIGKWLKQYGQTIYGTRGGPYTPGDYGACTCKGNKVFVHLLNDLKATSLPPLPVKITKASILNHGTVDVRQSDQGVEIVVGSPGHDEVDTVVVLELAGPAEDIGPILTAHNNLAFGKPACASSWKRAATENLDWNDRAFSPEMAFDGKDDTNWTAEDGATKAWIEVDLGCPQQLCEAVICEPQSGCIKDFELQRKVGDGYEVIFRGYELGMQAVIRFAPVEAQAIRLNVLSASGPPAVAEMMLTGPEHHADEKMAAFKYAKIGASAVRKNLRDFGPDKAAGNGEYATSLGKEPVWLDIDLGQYTRIDGATLRTGYGHNVEHYGLSCRSGEQWQTLVEADGRLDAQHEFRFPPVTARQFRMTVDSTRAKLFNVHLFQLHEAR
jgi:alpha-L-fucosidase